MTFSLILEANWVQNIWDLSTLFHPFSHIPRKKSARTSLEYFKSSSFNGLVQRQNRCQSTGEPLGKRVSEEKSLEKLPILAFVLDIHFREWRVYCLGFFIHVCCVNYPDRQK